MTISNLNPANQPDFTQNDKVKVTEVNGQRAINISCSTAIRNALAHLEIKEKTFPFPEADSVRSMAALNMASCPFSQHAALRTPFEQTFSRNEVRKQAPLILDKLLDALKNPEIFSPYDLGAEVIKSILQNLNPSLAPEIVESSKALISEPATDFVGSMMETILVLLLKYPDESEKIKTEWIAFLKNLPSENQFNIFEKFQVFVLGGKLNEIQYPPSKHIDAFVKEALRLYPPFLDILRLPIDEAAFDLHGIAIRSGDLIFLKLRESQINSCAEKQDEFFPDRFFNEPPLTETLPRNLLCYSSGVKKCLGQNLVNIELLLLTGLFGIFSPIDHQKAKDITLPTYGASSGIFHNNPDPTISNPLPRFLAACPLEYAQNFLGNPDLFSPEEVELFAKRSLKLDLNFGISIFR